ncbi:YggS family pyridoxal phosphate-dependent enzyme [Formicincola oecophyllae]|uniref:Pyridoxal phosphate homeostasis protein n=1 Tax=Formicincola oecophyllae TaxID=2558361 RepID=A0A4Y6UB93_9PROT|nr:YggS family pyridoxal phosphate-dependent enzyme [Formicincola oecophyllae]QDH13736.1 YggS family pyridoxal phosphate-dependent enzyme [Formicincola oecophyllae]
MVPLEGTAAAAIAERLAKVQASMDQATLEAHRPLGSVKLLAVSKFHPVESVLAACEAGQRLFGENRVQEAATKFPLVKERWPEVRLHIIGALQTNKARQAAALADVLESLDRPALASALEKASDSLGRLPILYVQVNTGAEPQKAGIALEEADRFIDDCKKRFGNHVQGLMAIPPQGQDPAMHFRLLTELATHHDLPVRSMGMSGDYGAAIRAGSTEVRVGTAIFGPRPLQL